MPGSLARPPKASTGARRRRRRLTGVLTEEHGGKPWRQHDGAAAVVAPRPPSSSCTDEAAAACSWPSTARHSGGVGVAVAVQPTQSREGHHQHRRAQGGAPASSPEQIEPQGLDPQWRSSKAMSAMGGGVDETLWSGGGAQQAGAEVPESGDKSRQSSPELGEGRVGDASCQRRQG
jgi:hypothetical protein